MKINRLLISTLLGITILNLNGMDPFSPFSSPEEMRDWSNRMEYEGRQSAAKQQLSKPRVYYDIIKTENKNDLIFYATTSHGDFTAGYNKKTGQYIVHHYPPYQPDFSSVVDEGEFEIIKSRYEIQEQEKEQEKK